jgi:hypothetical protein
LAEYMTDVDGGDDGRNSNCREIVTVVVRAVVWKVMT